MASINSTPTTNAGLKGLNEMINPLILGARTIDKGQIRVIPNVNDAVEVSRFTVAVDELEAPVATPSTANDSMTKDSVTITTGEAMFYDTFNPLRDFDEDWSYLWQVGKMTDAEYNSLVRQNIQSEVIKSIRNNVEKLIWEGDTASSLAYLNRFDGFIKLIEADSTVNEAAGTPAVLTASNIIAKMRAVINAQIEPVLENPNTTFLMNVNDFYKYAEALGDETIFKGTDIPNGPVARFGGFPIVTVGIPENHMVLTNTGTGRDSNLAAAAWMDADINSFKIDRLQSNSELFFVKALFKMGVNFMYGDQIAYYKPTA